METTPFPFFKFPSEIRELVYTEILIPEANRDKDENGYTHYHFDLRLMRVSRRMYEESRAIFMKLNPMVAVETPWDQASTHIRIEGYIPVLMFGDRARKYQHHVMTVKVDAPLFPTQTNIEGERFVIHADEVRAFCEFWNYQDMSNPRLNQHLRLGLELKESVWQADQAERQSLKWSLQRRLIEPFGIIKNLREAGIHGPHDPSLETSLRDKMAEPHRPAEECLDEALRLKELGNERLKANDNAGAVKLYEESFLALHIVCDGRRRSEWADVFFQREMRYGKHRGQAGGLARLVLRVKLVSNIVFAFLRMANRKGYEWAHFWGMRTINLLRTADEDEIEEPLLDFPAANELGKIYYRCALASKALGYRDEATNLLRVAMAYLPHDAQVKQEFIDAQGAAT